MLDFSTLAPLAAALLLAGVAAGILAGLLGVGGGIVIVPVLFQVFGFMGLDADLRMHLAVGTSLACIIPTSISSIRSHWKRGAIDVSLLRGWSPWVALGTISGALIAGLVRGPVLTGVFGTLAFVIAAHLLLTPENAHLADRPPKGPVRAGIGFVIGTVSAMAGIGGGSMTVPTLVVCNTPVRVAVGTSAAMGLIISLPGTIGFALSGWGQEGLPPLSVGYVSFLGLALITPTSILTAPIGARLAHAIPPRVLRGAFAVFLGLTAVKMYASLL